MKILGMCICVYVCVWVSKAVFLWMPGGYNGMQQV